MQVKLLLLIAVAIDGLNADFICIFPSIQCCGCQYHIFMDYSSKILINNFLYKMLNDLYCIFHKRL